METKLYSNRKLLNLLVPLLIEQALALLVGMADTVMVSSLGDAAVSGVSLVDMLCNVLLSLFAALATGGSVVAAQLLGAQRQKEACRVSNQLVLVSLGVSLAIMAPLLVFRRGLLEVMFDSVEANVMSSALTYLEITALSYPLIALYNAGAALCRSMNRARVTMVASVAVNLVNICGNAICIYGLGMGVEGAAIPTLISRGVGAVFMLIYLRNEQLQLHLVRGEWKPKLTMMREILHIGIPSGLENSLFQLGRVLVVRVITAFGTVQIAANAVANTMDSVGCLPGTAVNLAIITVVGQCVGAKDYKQARYYIRKLLVWAHAATLLLNGPMILLLDWILPIFAVSGETLALAKTLITIHNGMAILMWPLSFTLPNALRAASDVKFTMIVAIASMGLFRIVFSYILGIGCGWGAVGVWVAMLMDWLCRICFFVARYRGTTWEQQANLARVSG